VTQPPYEPPDQPGYPYGQPQTPPGYPPPYGPGQAPAPGYPSPYGPAYGWPPGYAPRGSYQQSGPPRRRRLLWTWIGFIGAAVVTFALFAGFAVQWTLAASRVGNPENTSATYGTVTAIQGSQLQVHVFSGTALVRRTETHILNQTNSNTSATQVDGDFDAVVTGAPAESVGNVVSFTYTTDETQGTYFDVAPSRIKAAGSLPVGLLVSFIAGILLGIVGVILLIVWLVKLRRNRRPTAPMYSPPPSYWPPNPQQH